MILLVQAITVVFAIICALLNEVPVMKMIQYGASISEEKKFHFANGAVKIIYSLAVAFVMNLTPLDKIIFFNLLLLVQWLVFDIALNLFLAKSWHYIGETAQIDKILRKFLGQYAGEVKAIVVLAVIIIVNIIFFYP